MVSEKDTSDYLQLHERELERDKHPVLPGAGEHREAAEVVGPLGVVEVEEGGPACLGLRYLQKTKADPVNGRHPPLDRLLGCCVSPCQRLLLCREGHTR